jgi:hypothetical protein
MDKGEEKGERGEGKGEKTEKLASSRKSNEVE